MRCLFQNSHGITIFAKLCFMNNYHVLCMSVLGVEGFFLSFLCLASMPCAIFSFFKICYNVSTGIMDILK